jgi:hypothetical protein
MREPETLEILTRKIFLKRQAVKLIREEIRILMQNFKDTKGGLTSGGDSRGSQRPRLLADPSGRVHEKKRCGSQSEFVSG